MSDSAKEIELLAKLRRSQELAAQEDADASAPVPDAATKTATGKVVMRDEGGALWNIDPEKVTAAQRSGYSIASGDEVAEGEKALEWGGAGDAALAGLAGAARGATVGLSDVALTETGLVDPSTLANLKKYNPTASTVGEVGGTIAPLLASGGTSLVARGLAAVGAPARGVAGLGNLAARAAGGLGAGSGILGTAARFAAGGAAEGALYGMGQEVSERALQQEGYDLDELGEALLGAGIEGAQQGAVFGGAAGAAGAALRTGGAALGSTLAKPLKGLYERAKASGVSTPATLGGAVVGGLVGGPVGAAAGAAIGAGASKLRRTGMISEAGQAAERELAQKIDNITQVVTHQSDDAAAAATASSIDDIKNAAQKLMGEKGVGEKLERAIYLRDEMPKIIKRDARDDARELQGLFKNLDRAHGTGRQSAGGFTLGMKDATVRRKMAEDGGRMLRIKRGEEMVDVPFASREAADYIRERTFGQIDSMKRISEQFAAKADEYMMIPGFAGKMKKLKKISAAQANRVAAADKIEDPVERIAQYYQIADQQKRAYGRIADQIPMDGNDVHAVMSRSSANMRTFLEDADIWGRAATEYQVPVNAAYTRELSTRREFLKRFSAMVGTEGRKVDPYKLLESADPAALQQLYEGHILDRVGSDLDKRLFAQWLQDAKALNNALAKAHGLEDGAMLERTRGMNATIDKLLTRVGQNERRAVEYETTMQLLGQVEQMPVFGSLAKMYVQGRRMLQDDGLVGQAIGATEMQSLRRAASDIGKKAKEAAEAFVSGKRSEASAPATPRIGSVTSSSAAAPSAARPAGRKETLKQAYEQSRDAVRDAVANPAQLADRIGQTVRNVAHHAPVTIASMSRAAMHGAAFLSSKLPAENLHASVIQNNDDTQRTSDRAQAQFLRYYDAVHNPMGVIEAFARGDATREGLEALRAVYPKIHARLVREAVDHVAQMEKPPAYSQQLQLSYLLGVPVHYTMTPRFLQQTQAMYGASEERRQQDRPIAPSQSRAPRLAAQQETLSQRTEGGASR